MTIAIALRVKDGVVLAADSASSLTRPGTFDVTRVFNHANKIVNLYKGLPIGAMTWGTGSVGFSSTAIIFKDIRRMFSEPTPGYENWLIQNKKCTMSEIADRVFEYFVNDRIPAAKAANLPHGAMGICVSGYSPGADVAEAYEIAIDDQGQCAGPVSLQGGIPHDLRLYGQPEAVIRLILGYGTLLPIAIEKALGKRLSHRLTSIMDEINKQLPVFMVEPNMPIQDAIELADFLAQTSAQFVRFTQDHQTVGGTIELAAITKHEGFKWVRRKLYYDRSLNPEG